MSPIKMQRLESGIRLAVELYENINGKKVEGVAGLLSEDCVLESAYPSPNGTLYKGKERVRQYYEVLLGKRKGLSVSTEEILGFGHRCIIRWKNAWIDDDGKEMALRGTDIFRERNDLICEVLSYSKSDIPG